MVVDGGFFSVALSLGLGTESYEPLFGSRNVFSLSLL